MKTISLILLCLIGCASKPFQLPKQLIGTQTICDNNGICVVHPFDLTAWRSIEPTGVLPLWAKRAPNVNQIAFKGGASYCPSPYYVQADFTGYKNGTGTWTNHCYLKKDISHPLDGRASWECIPGTEHPVGQAKHVTRSQWEAAQGLYVFNVCYGADTTKFSMKCEVIDNDRMIAWISSKMTCFDKSGDVDCRTVLSMRNGSLSFSDKGGMKSDTLPPSGDAK